MEPACKPSACPVTLPTKLQSPGKTQALVSSERPATSEWLDVTNRVEVSTHRVDTRLTLLNRFVSRTTSKSEFIQRLRGQLPINLAVCHTQTALVDRQPSLMRILLVIVVNLSIGDMEGKAVLTF